MIETGQFPSVTCTETSKIPGSLNSIYGLGSVHVDAWAGTQCPAGVPGINADIPHWYSTGSQPSALTSERSCNWTISPGHIWSTTWPSVFKISKFATGFWSNEIVKESELEVPQFPVTVLVMV